MPVGISDQTAMPVLQIDPIELNFVEEFTGGFDHGFHIQTPRGLRPKRSSGSPRPALGLGLVRRQPAHQRFELVATLGDLAVNCARGATSETSIPGPSGLRCPI